MGNSGSDFTWNNGWTEGTGSSQASSRSTTADNTSTATGTDTARATHNGPNRLVIVAATIAPLCVAALDSDGDGDQTPRTRLIPECADVA